ncbi:MAG: UDP-N-acetylmuramoyl-L-alanine--D-glutamate ligase [Fimbriimonadales bacterium]|nr:MAG: UDP-N-acetylmuramoylalanine--D-glutamate ligase [Fimbriimonadales bacterium]
MDEFAGKRVVVLGAGRSGVAAASALARRNARVEVYDRKPLTELPHADALLAQGIPIHTECDAPASLQGYDLVVVSPGAPPSHPIFALADAAGVPVWSEIELGYRIARAPIIAITGTNGKTTTTMLIHHILRAMGQQAHLCGNIAGIEDEQTLTEAAERAAPDAWLVAEVSSFQLLHTHAFRPKIAVITNIRNDHLDYHGSWEAYALAKAKILANQTPNDWAVLNADDPGVQWVVERGHGEAGKILYFSTASPFVKVSGENLNIADMFKPALHGVHGLENALAAACVASILGCTAGQLREAFASFRGAPHRMEFVGEWGGVRYINNSMCTNADALEKSLQATPKPCLVIAGGVDKNESIPQLAESLARHARYVLLIGRDGQAIADALQALGYTHWEYVESLARAVSETSRLVRAGDTVILAPGCASFDQFRNFADRGEQFRRLIREVHECDGRTH